MGSLSITFTSRDWEQLDRTVAHVITSIPAGDVSDVQVTILSGVEAGQRRRLTVQGPSDRVIARIARLDLPQAVAVQIVDSP